jgi:hypothetical protein
MMVPIKSSEGILLAVVPADSRICDVKEAACHALDSRVHPSVRTTSEGGFVAFPRNHYLPVPVLVSSTSSHPETAESSHVGIDLDNPDLVDEFCAGLALALQDVTASRGGYLCPEWVLSVEEIGKEGIWLYAHVLPQEQKALIMISLEGSTRGEGAAAQIDLLTGEIEKLNSSLLREKMLGCEDPNDLSLTRAAFSMEMLGWLLTSSDFSFEAIVSPIEVDDHEWPTQWELQLRSC